MLKKRQIFCVLKCILNCLVCAKNVKIRLELLIKLSFEWRGCKLWHFRPPWLYSPLYNARTFCHIFKEWSQITILLCMRHHYWYMLVQITSAVLLHFQFPILRMYDVYSRDRQTFFSNFGIWFNLVFWKKSGDNLDKVFFQLYPNLSRLFWN